MALVITKIMSSPSRHPEEKVQRLDDIPEAYNILPTWKTVPLEKDARRTTHLLIYVRQSVNQTSQKIPSPILETPPTTEQRTNCLVPINEVQPGTLWRTLIDRYPSIYIEEIISAGKICVISVASSCVQFIRGLELPFELEPDRYRDNSGSTNNDDERGRKPEARTLSKRRSLRDTIQGVLPQFGLGRYQSLPTSLIGVLTSRTGESAQRIMEQTYDTMSWIKKPENDFLLLLCYCLDSEESCSPYHEWMTSSEGIQQYCRVTKRLRHHMNQEEIALSLTVLRGYEMVFWRADEQLEFVDASLLDEFMDQIHGEESIARPNLWQQVGYSFRSACGQRCHPTALGWLDTVLGEAMSSNLSDGPLKDYWSQRVTDAENALDDRPRSVPMQRELPRRVMVD